MKKNYLVFILMISAHFTHAQLIRGYGLKLGATISNQYWEYSPSSRFEMEFENRVGFNVGLFAEFFNIPTFSIVTEVNYVQKGMKKEVVIRTVFQPEGNGEYATWDTRIDYLNLSSLGKIRLDFDIIRPYIVIGPKFDINIKYKSTLGTAESIEESYNNNRVGYKMGIGTEIQLTSFNLLLEILYDSDFNELFKNQHLEITSNSIEVRCGLMF